LGTFGANQLNVAGRSLAVPLEVTIPITLRVLPSGDVSVHVDAFRSNLEALSLELGYSRPLVLPSVRVKVGTQTLKLNQRRLEAELEAKHGVILQALQELAAELLRERAPDFLNDLIARHFQFPFREINQMLPPGAPQDLPPHRYYRWGMKPSRIERTTHGTRVGLDAFVDDPEKPIAATDTKTETPKNRRPPRLEIEADSDISAAVAFDQSLINRILSLSHGRGYYETTRTSDGSVIRLLAPPTLQALPTEMKSGQAIGRAKIRVSLEHRLPKGSGLRNLIREQLVTNPIRYEIDAWLNLEKADTGALRVSVERLDERSLRIAPSSIRISALAGSVYAEFYSVIRSANATLTKAPHALIERLPIPQEVGYIPLELERVGTDDAGYLLLYLKTRKGATHDLEP